MPLIYAALLMLTVGGARLVVRALISQFAGSNKKPVVIYGAGSAGRQLAIGLAAGAEYYVTAFIDDDVTKQGSIVQGIQVISISGLRGLIADEKAYKVLLALPSASRSRRNQIINQLAPMSVKVQTIPGIKDMIEELEISAGRVTHILTSLEKKNYISRRVDEKDKRNHLVDLTPESRKFINQLTKKHIELHQNILNNISEENRAVITQVMTELIGALQEWSSINKSKLEK